MIVNTRRASGWDEIATLEAPYRPRHDFQGISDAAELQRVMARIPGYEYARL